MLTLRPYQRKNADALLECLSQNVDPIYFLPTGGGKTEVFTSVTASYLEMGKEVGIFVHRKELLRQASKRLKQHGIAHGIIMPGHGLTSHNVHVASIDTIGRRLDELSPWLRSLDLAIPDEAHHSVANKWQHILSMPRRRLGPTATPCRLDGKGLGSSGLFQEIVKGPSIKWLTKNGYLCEADVFYPPSSLSLFEVSKRLGDYATNEMAREIISAGLIELACDWYDSHAPGQPAVAFWPNIATCQLAAEAFSACGWKSVSVDGSMSEQDREAAIGHYDEYGVGYGGLADGSVQVLHSCELIGEGLDLPAVSVVIGGRATQSLSLYLQHVGRGLRPHPDKSVLTYLDLVGNSERFGRYDVQRQWNLQVGIKGLERAINSTWRCRSCHRIHTKPDAKARMECPCGSVQTVSGFLPIDMDNHPPINDVPVEKLVRMKFVKAVRHCKTETDLIAYGRLRGMKNPHAWAYVILQKRATMARRDKTSKVHSTFQNHWRGRFLHKKSAGSHT